MSRFLPPFLLGLTATSFQIFLMREFCAHFYGNEVIFGLVLGSWLFWGGVGSLVASRLRFLHDRIFEVYAAVLLLFPISLCGLRFSRFFLNLLPGEITGMMPAFFAAFLLSFLVSFPLGVLFVLNVRHFQGNLTLVYILESLGAAFGGLAVYFFLVPYFSNWHGTAVIGGLTAILALLSLRPKRKVRLFAAALVYLTAFSLFDLPSQRIFWRPFNLTESKDSLYGKLQVIRTEEQVSFYNNGFLIYSYPATLAAEESVHFALLQKPQAKKILLIGGGAGGSLSEALKHPGVEVDYVELDPEIIRLSLNVLPEEGRVAFDDRRVKIIYRDGRSFLKQTSAEYDLILLNLPEPATAQVNRYYTREFFLLADKRLAEDGVISFRVPSAENYISPDLQKFLSTLYYTLKSVFPRVEVVPGETNIFLGSSAPLTLSADLLAERLISLNLKTTYVNPPFLLSRLNPLRVETLRDKLQRGKQEANLDFRPISYFFNSVLWSTQFRTLEATILKFFSRLPSVLMLDLPLGLFLLLLFFFWFKKKETSFYLMPLAVMGFTTIAAELILILWFQSVYGFVYGRIALLLAAFMFGLFAGAWLSSKRKTADYLRLIFIQAGFILLFLLLERFLRIPPSEFFVYAFLLLLGILAGDLFIVANHLYLQRKKNYGMGYALDLGGAFLGAMVTASLLIPLFGLPLLVRYLLLLNSFCFLFLLFRRK